MGGYDEDTVDETDVILQYDANADNWIIMPQTLTTPADHITATLVAVDYVNCN